MMVMGLSNLNWAKAKEAQKTSSTLNINDNFHLFMVPSFCLVA
jgi:hypothetical protein